MSESLTAAQRVAIARHPRRPNIDDYVQVLFPHFFPMRGDRLCGEDTAILGGTALFHGQPVTVIGTRKGKTLEENLRGNFGMPVDRGTGIFNGDFGRIVEIDLRSEIMTVIFDDARTVEYPFSDLEDLDLAYAITVHKSQGSEYPAVILPLLTGPSGLFNRNLLYTAITRARSCVVLLGSRDAVGRMIANTRRTRRYTGLRDRIRELDPAAEPV